MDYFDLKAIADRVGRALMDDLKAGKIDRIGGETIEAACADAITGLDARDRDLLINLGCRRVVELTVELTSL